MNKIKPAKRYFIGLGSVMWLDENGHERFIPISVDKETGLKYFEGAELADGNYAELDLVGEELTLENDFSRTLNDYWDNIKKLTREAK